MQPPESMCDRFGRQASQLAVRPCDMVKEVVFALNAGDETKVEIISQPIVCFCWLSIVKCQVVLKRGLAEAAGRG